MVRMIENVFSYLNVTLFVVLSRKNKSYLKKIKRSSICLLELINCLAMSYIFSSILRELCRYEIQSYQFSPIHDETTLIYRLQMGVINFLVRKLSMSSGG